MNNRNLNKFIQSHKPMMLDRAYAEIKPAGKPSKNILLQKHYPKLICFFFILTFI